MTRHLLSGITVVESGDELVEYTGMTLAGLGAEVIKIEPPDGSPTRRYAPFVGDVAHPDRSLHFWHYNRGKRSVCLDLREAEDRARFRNVAASADVLLRTRRTAAAEEVDWAALDSDLPVGVVVAEMSPFGLTGPWSRFRGGDLVQLALGGQVMCCGYDPLPSGTYDLPPVAPQMWHSNHIAGEQLTVAILAALAHRGRSGEGQRVACSVHEAAAANVELAVTSWIYRCAPLYRMTCRHARESVTDAPAIVQTKDGRWCAINFIGPVDTDAVSQFLANHGMATDQLCDEAADGETAVAGGVGIGREVPGTSGPSARGAHAMDLLGRLFRRYTFENAPWAAAQRVGIMCAPLRLPHENLADAHWWERRTFTRVAHPRLGRDIAHVTGKWRSDRTEWRVDGPAPHLDEHRHEVLTGTRRPPGAAAGPTAVPTGHRSGRRWALDGVRVLDFTWFLASAGGTRFLAALGAECIKVEWKGRPDTRRAVMAPQGGRAAREAAIGPLPGVDDGDMGGQFNNKNAGKRGISLNLAHPRGRQLACQLVQLCDVVAEGFSPGVMERNGLGYDTLRTLRPDVIYASQSGTGAAPVHAIRRAVGPIAQALSGLSEQSGLPEPAIPAGWGYSYLDWIGAYSFATAILAAIAYRDRTGHGQWIDASQIETGIFLTGVSILDWEVNRRRYARTGNRATHLQAAPHGIYPCAGLDRWIAIACLSQTDWEALVTFAGREDWGSDSRFLTAADRVEHEHELDAVVGAWTREWERYELMAGLQAAGVPAGVCQTGEDLCDHDPQLRHDDWLTEVTGSKIGRWPLVELPFTMSATPPHIGGRIDRGAPCYGEDNDYVFGELLGLPAAEIEQLQRDDVI